MRLETGDEVVAVASFGGEKEKSKDKPGKKPEKKKEKRGKK